MSTISLFVGNLPCTATHHQLMQLFSPFNPIMVAYAPGRNFAYVQLHPEVVEPAVQLINGHQLGNHELSVRRADFTESRTERAGQ